jgi:hypothetical protein
LKAALRLADAASSWCWLSAAAAPPYRVEIGSGLLLVLEPEFGLIRLE